MTTASDLVEGAFENIGIPGVGQTLTAADSALGLRRLNNMLDEWAGENFMVYAVTEESFTLTADQEEYSIGESGSPDFDTVRPEEILDGTFIRSGDTDYPLTIISLAEYQYLPVKGSSGTPEKMAYSPTYPNGAIFLYGTPGSADDIYLSSLKQLSSFSALLSVVTLPPGYRNAIEYNLAIHLSPAYGKSITVELAALASGAKAKIKRRAAANRVSPVRLEVGRLIRGGGSGNINSFWG